MAKRPEAEQKIHYMAIQRIAKKRLDYPELGWVTYTNHPEQKFPLTKNGNKFWPDIIVADSDNITQIYGEVETESTITVHEAKQWKSYAVLRRKPFYLYVPKGFGKQAKRLAQGIFIAGIREFLLTPNGIEVWDI